MIDYGKIKRGDILRIVGAGAPSFAKLGDMVRVLSAAPNRVTVERTDGETCDFVFNCGAARLESTEDRDDFDIDDRCIPDTGESDKSS